VHDPALRYAAIFSGNDSEIEDFLAVESHYKHNIEGWALDAGLTWEAPISLNPTLTLGYAIGTSIYRQTGYRTIMIAFVR